MYQFEHLEIREGYLIVRPYGDTSFLLPIGLCGNALEYSCMFNVKYEELHHIFPLDSNLWFC